MAEPGDEEGDGHHADGDAARWSGQTPIGQAPGEQRGHRAGGADEGEDPDRGLGQAVLTDQLVGDGRVVYPNGIEPEPRKRPKVRMIPYDAVGGRAPLERLNLAVTESRLKVVIEKVYKLDQAAEAHARIEQGHVVGRIVLEIR
jgi:hypothetical protein